MVICSQFNIYDFLNFVSADRRDNVAVARQTWVERRNKRNPMYSDNDALAASCWQKDVREQQKNIREIQINIIYLCFLNIYKYRKLVMRG